jgi:hypothetical protein
MLFIAFAWGRGEDDSLGWGKPSLAYIPKALKQHVKKERGRR